MTDYTPSEIEKKWQRAWLDARIYEAEPDPGKEKFFMIFAYPGVSGYLHIGHMRGYTYTDVLTRFRRMQGYNVLFPVGSHATGNLAYAFASKVERGDPVQIEYLKANGCSDEEIERLKDPMEVIRFFNDVYVNDYWKKFGFLADWRRFTCTANPDYQKFIEWQFLKLNEKGLLIKKPYYAPFCIKCGPVAVDPSETDLSKGGTAEKYEYTLLKFRIDLNDGYDNEYLVAATLRPETVFGQTNFWIDPEISYVRVKVGDEIWIISREAAEKLKYQKDEVEVIGEVPGKELIGKRCVAPMIHREIPILPSEFCDPSVGTGLVTSVPSDAPADWMGLHDLQKNPEMCRKYGLDPETVRKIEVIPIIDTKGWGPTPAVEICEKLGIEDQHDPKLNEAKKEIYSAGFHSGKMNENCGEYAGIPVEQAKEEIKERMIEGGEADIMYDFSEEVVCRCGAPVVVKKIPDQWFINYADPELTEKSRAHAREMTILPQDYANNIVDILEWFKERACVRMGRWIGTEFPLDRKWIIEAISDSTLYPAYYVVSKYANDGSIRAEQMTEEFFDYIYLGRGSAEGVAKATGIDKGTVEKIRGDFEYWYPLDINLGGKEHMTVHFPVFLMNHVAILDRKDWPRGILVHWYLTMKGGKISKSKGGAQPIPDAAERFGIDAMRLYYSHIASPFVDVEWDEKAALNYRSRLARIWTMTQELMDYGEDGAREEIDLWLLSRFNIHLENIERMMDSFDMRGMSTIVYFEMMNDIRRYMNRGGRNRGTIREVLDIWTKAMAPVTPHLAEEVWNMSGHDTFVSVETFPEPDTEKISESALELESFFEETMDDIREIIRVTGKEAKRAAIYTAADWKWRITDIALSMEKPEIGLILKEAMQDPDIRKQGKAVQNFVKNLVGEMRKRPEIRNRLPYLKAVGEFLAANADYMEKETGAEISVFKEGDEGIYDPAGKSRAALPWRVAVYLE